MYRDKTISIQIFKNIEGFPAKRLVEFYFLQTHPQQRHLQKEMPVCISIEGHGDHYIKRVMQRCRGWSYIRAK
ncbi:hypothetical protein DAPPUDRAFT_237386 [Daphnia pulex]|uniref:Uncharacterized protein n=1 Tax=Daphnia pulex TaxID=6669 RepID=E9G3T1_DAPPU|nr:hypothetical protein DAPPUDRAFT_237386 [Daphnia pulex]|eukprot:EFX85826.1 hypothetical protein DAPPUDRAFT_237386 [Daphnia pulex]